jgi:hypothetical protein
MPECELCGEDVDKLYECKMCGTMFCEYCGLVEDRICLNCMVDLEYEEEEYDEDYDDDMYIELPSKVKRPMYRV